MRHATKQSRNGHVFQDLMKSCRLYRKKFADEIQNMKKEDYLPSLLDKVIIKFRSIKAPLKVCIFSRYSTGGIGTYIYNHGEWIEMTTEYLFFIEKDFVEMLSSYFLDSSELPMLLPWKYPRIKGKDEALEKENRNKLHFTSSKIKTMKSKWRHHYETVCKGKKFDECLIEVEKLCGDKTDLVCKFHELKEMSSEKKAAYLYRFLESKLNEDGYNYAHTLLGMILPDSLNTTILTCDKIKVNEIEICDIMIFDNSTTYLVHVKDHFSGESMEAVCRQIRNAADIIFREQTLAKGIGVIDMYWEVLTKPANNPATHTNEVKNKLENMTKAKFKAKFGTEQNIVFVLACRDTRIRENFRDDVDYSLDVNIEDEIKKKLKEKSNEIIAKMKANMFMTNEGMLTNKFILEGKNTKEAFKANIKQWDCIENEKIATNVVDVLMTGLSKSKSTIAKMEIIRLVKDFDRYHVGERRLQLKILSVDGDFPAI